MYRSEAMYRTLALTGAEITEIAAIEEKLARMALEDSPEHKKAREVVSSSERQRDWEGTMEDVFEECFKEQRKEDAKRRKKGVEMTVQKVKVYQPVISIKPWI